MVFEASIFRESYRRKVLEERHSLIGYILFGLSLFFIIIDWNIVGILLFLSTIIFYYVGIVLRWNKIESNFGSFPFKMIISSKGIEMKEKLYPLSEISISRFSIYDYRGKPKNKILSGIKYPVKSNGTDNHIHFTYNQSKYELQFRIDHKKHFEKAQEIRQFIRTS